MASARDVWELSRAILADADGLVVVLKIYMDESGIHDGSPVVTVGAYLARPSVWQAWTKEWNRRKRPIKVFHAADCQNLKNEFKGWHPENERDPFVINLLPALTSHHLVGRVGAIHLHDFELAFREHPRIRERFTTYTACFQWAVMAVLEEAATSYPGDRLAFFHENNDFEADALRSFSYVKKDMNPAGQVMTLSFGGKNDYVPLQAADVLAYEANRRLRNIRNRPRRSWLALDPKNRIKVHYFNKDNMPELMALLLREDAKRAASVSGAGRPSSRGS